MIQKYFSCEPFVSSLFERVEAQAAADCQSQSKIESLAFKIGEALERDLQDFFSAAMQTAKELPELRVDAFKTFYERVKDHATQQEIEEFRDAYLAQVQYIFASGPKTDTVDFRISGVHAYSGSCRLTVEAIFRNQDLPVLSTSLWLANDEHWANFHVLINLACHKIILDSAACYLHMSR